MPCDHFMASSLTDASDDEDTFLPSALAINGR